MQTLIDPKNQTWSSQRSEGDLDVATTTHAVILYAKSGLYQMRVWCTIADFWSNSRGGIWTACNSSSCLWPDFCHTLYCFIDLTCNKFLFEDMGHVHSTTMRLGSNRDLVSDGLKGGQDRSTNPFSLQNDANAQVEASQNIGYPLTNECSYFS